ncbi:MAG: glycosyltransferase family 39 protein [Candidatus Eiseniibacteriota bacterium]
MRRGLTEAAGVLVAAFLWHAAYSGYGLAPQDEGWLLNAASRVAAGETPYRDFTTAYVPGTYWLVAGVLDGFGPSLPAVRLLFALLRALTVLLVYLLARRLTSRPLSFGAAALTALIPGPWHKTFFTLVPLAALVPAARWESAGGLRWLALAGAAAGLGAWVRQDAALAAMAGVSWVAWAGRPRAAESRPRALATAAGSAALAFLGPAAWLAAQGVTAGDVLAQSGAGAASIGAPQAASAASMLRLSAPDLAAPHAQIVAALVLSLPLLAAFALRASLGDRRRRDHPAAATLGALALVSLLLSNQLFRDHILVRFLQCGAFAYILFAAVVGAARPRVRLALLAVPVAFAGYVLFTDGGRGDVPVEYTGTVAVRAGANAALDVRGHVLHVRDELARDLAPLAGFIREHTAEGEPILVFGQPAILHFLANRPSADRRIRFTQEHLAALDLDYWARIYAAGCRHVVMPRSWGELGPLSIYPKGRSPELVRRFGPWAVWALP